MWLAQYPRLPLDITAIWLTACVGTDDCRRPGRIEHDAHYRTRSTSYNSLTLCLDPRDGSHALYQDRSFETLSLFHGAKNIPRDELFQSNTHILDFNSDHLSRLALCAAVNLMTMPFSPVYASTVQESTRDWPERKSAIIRFHAVLQLALSDTVAGDIPNRYSPIKNSNITLGLIASSRPDNAYRGPSS